MRPIVKIFFCVFTVLSMAPLQVSARTCESIFRDSQSVSVPTTVSNLLSPKTAPGKVVRARIVSRLLNKTAAGRAYARAATSMSAQAGGSSTNVTDVKSEKVAAIQPSTVSFEPKRRFAIANEFLEDGSMNWISWVSEPAVAVARVDKANPPHYLYSTEMLDVELVNADTGYSRQNLVFASRNIGSLNDSPILVVREGGLSRFLDKTTLEEVRPALQDAEGVQIVGQFIAYRQNGRHYLTSLSPADFGLPANAPVVREILSPSPANKQIDMTFVKALDPSARQILIRDKGQDRIFHFDFTTAGYQTSSKLPGPVQMQNIDGLSYNVSHVPGRYTWKILTQGEHGFQTIEVRSVLAHLGSEYEILEIFGSGREKSILFRAGASYQLVKFGFTGHTIVGDKNIFHGLTRHANRFLVLSAKSLSSSYLGKNPPDLAVDLKTGLTYPLRVQKGYTVILDSKRYISIEKDWTDPKQPGVMVFNADGLVHKSIVRIHDLETSGLERQFVFDGSVELVSGTRLLHIYNGELVQFFDIETEQILWAGPASSKAEVSPDGSRVAYLDDMGLVVMVLGERPTSRRAF